MVLFWVCAAIDFSVSFSFLVMQNLFGFMTKCGKLMNVYNVDMVSAFYAMPLESKCFGDFT